MPFDYLYVGGNITLTHNTAQGLIHLHVPGDFVCFADSPTPSVFTPVVIGGLQTPFPNACIGPGV
jgi:hypothetical protein